MPAETINLAILVGSFRVVDCTTLCTATHSPKDRKGLMVDPASALDDSGVLKRKYEALTDADGNPSGQYALRDDVPVYKDADDRLKEALRAIADELSSVCFSIGGGTLILPESNYPAWDIAVNRIDDIVKSANADLAIMRVDTEDPESPLINEFLKTGDKKPIGLSYRPMLHPIVRLADPDAKAQALALVESTRAQIKEIIDAVGSADPIRIGAVLTTAKDIDKAIADGGTRDSIRRVLDTARSVKTAAETAKNKANLIARADTRLQERTIPIGASDSDRNRILAAIDRDNTAIAGFTASQAEAMRQVAIGRRDMIAAAEDINGRFASLDIGDASLLVDKESATRIYGSDLLGDRFGSLDERSEIDRTPEEKIAAAVVQIQTGEQVPEPDRVLDFDEQDPDLDLDLPVSLELAEAIRADQIEAQATEQGPDLEVVNNFDATYPENDIPLSPIERSAESRAAIRDRIRDAAERRGRR